VYPADDYCKDSIMFRVSPTGDYCMGNTTEHPSYQQIPGKAVQHHRRGTSSNLSNIFWKLLK
jgi:hypothetical protein